MTAIGTTKITEKDIDNLWNEMYKNENIVYHSKVQISLIRMRLRRLLENQADVKRQLREREENERL